MCTILPVQRLLHRHDSRLIVDCERFDRVDVLSAVYAVQQPQVLVVVGGQKSHDRRTDFRVFRHVHLVQVLRELWPVLVDVFDADKQLRGRRVHAIRHRHGQVVLLLCLPVQLPGQQHVAVVLDHEIRIRVTAFETNTFFKNFNLILYMLQVGGEFKGGP